jgi:hypothetical protein
VGGVGSTGPVLAMTESGAGDWRAFAAVLATMPEVIERLAAEHTPTPDGRWCTACTTPGRGTPQAHWPCALAALAAEAARLRSAMT